MELISLHICLLSVICYSSVSARYLSDHFKNPEYSPYEQSKLKISTSFRYAPGTYLYRLYYNIKHRIKSNLFFIFYINQYN